MAEKHKEPTLASCVASVSHRLTKLDIAIKGPIDPFVALTFPSLTNLAFGAYSVGEKDQNKTTSMKFWTRHPQLVYLLLNDDHTDNRAWRDSSLFVKDANLILPKLKGLAVRPKLSLYVPTDLSTFPSHQVKASNLHALRHILETVENLSVDFQGAQRVQRFQFVGPYCHEAPILQTFEGAEASDAVIQKLVKTSPLLEELVLSREPGSSISLSVGA